MLNSAEIIRAARKQKGWSLRKLAAESGVNYMTIFHVEQEEHGTSLYSFQALLDAMGMELKVVRKE